jgi:hypothetical protein
MCAGMCGWRGAGYGTVLSPLAEKPNGWDGQGAGGRPLLDCRIGGICVPRCLESHPSHLARVRLIVCGGVSQRW